MKSTVEQLTIFDIPLGNALRDQAIAQVDENATATWKSRAMDAIKRIAQTKARFTSDEVWNYVEKPREPRALGSLMRKASTNKWIVLTDDPPRKSRIPTQHSQPLQVWRSLLIGEG